MVMKMKDINEIISAVDNYIYKNFTVIDDYQKKINESMIYSLSSGGKRVRAILCVLSYLTVSGEEDFEKSLPYAAAIELIHTYSLIHDDLPAMDNDDLRRGKPTNHKVFSEAIAVLAGDGLLNTSAELLSKNLENYYQDLGALQKAIKAMKYIYNCSGVHGMIGGQVIDLETDVEYSEDYFENMYKLKTAALIRAAIVSGAIMAGATDADIVSLEEFSNCIGIAYQITDDLLDYEEDKNKDKKTISNFKSKEDLKIRIKELSERSKIELQALDYNTDELEEYVDMLMNRSK
jgi:geranylgeranyl diphosphate synthase type II